MKHILVYITFYIMICGFGCEGLAFSSRLPSNEVEKIEIPPPPEVIDAYAGRQMLFDVATNDLCAKTAHDVQGTPPKSYMKGIVLTYVKTVCNPDSDVYKIASQPVGDASKDALAHYGLKPQTAHERLNMVFSLMIGSAARESSWRWCVGRDVQASASVIRICLAGGKSCEAGLYQTSFDSISQSPALQSLFDEYSEYPSGCFATEYKGATKCSAENLKDFGSGKPKEFQTLTKECPGFATEYHAIMARINRSHYGPINRKKSEIKPACVGMFERVRKLIVANPNLCNVL